MTAIYGYQELGMTAIYGYQELGKTAIYGYQEPGYTNRWVVSSAAGRWGNPFLLLSPLKPLL